VRNVITQLSSFLHKRAYTMNWRGSHDYSLPTVVAKIGFGLGKEHCEFIADLGGELSVRFSCWLKTLQSLDIKEMLNLTSFGNSAGLVELDALPLFKQPCKSIVRQNNLIEGRKQVIKCTQSTKR